MFRNICHLQIVYLAFSANVDRTITSITTFFRLELCTATTDFQVLVAYLFFYRESFCFCLPSLFFSFPGLIDADNRFPIVSIFSPTLFRIYFLPVLFFVFSILSLCPHFIPLFIQTFCLVRSTKSASL